MDEYLGLIKSEFPNFSFKNVKDLTEGFDHQVYLLDKTYIFRFPRDPYYKRFIFVEMKILEQLKGEKVPYYIFKGSSFGGYRILEGEALTPLRYKKINDKTRFHKEIAKLLTKLHTLESVEGLQKRETPYFFDENYEEKLSIISTFFNEEEMKKIITLLESLRDRSFPHFCITHSDLHLEHLLIKDGELGGVIDFSDATLTDPAIDFHIFWNYGEEAILSVYEKYKGPKDDDFLYRAHIYNLLDYLSALHQSVIHKKESWKKPILERLRVILHDELVEM